MYLPSRNKPFHLSDCNRPIIWRIKPVLFLVVIVSLLSCLHADSHASEYSTVFVPRETIRSENYDSLSPDGNAGLARFYTEADGTSLAIWRYDEREVGELIYAPVGFRSLFATDFSADATRIVGWMYYQDDGNASESFLWTKETGFRVLIPPYDGGVSQRRISADGQTVGGVSGANSDEPIVWKWTESDGFEQLPVNYEETGSLRGITPDASTWGFANAVYHTDGRLDFTPENENGFRTVLADISDDGRYAIGRLHKDEDRTFQAIRWEIGTENIDRMGTLGEFQPGVSRSAPWVISADGDVVLGVNRYGGNGCSNFRNNGFVWDEAHGIRDLALVLRDEYDLTVGPTSSTDPTPRLGNPTGISDDRRTVFGHTREFDCGEAELWYARLDWPLGTIRGDLEWDGDLDVADLDKLLGFIRDGEFDSQSDFNFDDVVDQADLNFWVHDLKQTYFGDSNLDGEFNSSDLVVVFEAGQYEDSVALNSTWGTGDWNGDGEFTTSDLVKAFEDGGYEQGPRAAVQAVPEPSAAALTLAALASLMAFIRNRKVTR